MLRAHSFAAGATGLAIGAEVSATTGLVVMGEATGLAIGEEVSATTGLVVMGELVVGLTGTGVSTGLGEGEGVSPKQQYKNTSSIAIRRSKKQERESVCVVRETAYRGPTTQYPQLSPTTALHKTERTNALTGTAETGQIARIAKFVGGALLRTNEWSERGGVGSGSQSGGGSRCGFRDGGR